MTPAHGLTLIELLEYVAKDEEEARDLAVAATLRARAERLREALAEEHDRDELTDGEACLKRINAPTPPKGDSPPTIAEEVRRHYQSPARTTCGTCGGTRRVIEQDPPVSYDVPCPDCSG